MNKLELESIERIYSHCREIAGKLEAAGFESMDALIDEVKSLQERLKREEEYTALYRDISSDALDACNQLIDCIKRNNIPQSEQVGVIIERMAESTFSIPKEMGVPYVVVCSKGTWLSPEYLKCNQKISPLAAPDEAPAMLKWKCYDELVCTRCGAEFKDEILFIRRSDDSDISFCPACGVPIKGIEEEA